MKIVSQRPSLPTRLALIMADRDPFPLLSRRLFLTLLLLVGLSLPACGPTISEFSARAYEHTTSLKVESLALMENATEPYATHASAVQSLRTELRKAREFAEGRPNNQISAQQWQILIDPERDLLGGFLRDWKKQSSFSEAFVREKKKQIAQAFDTIIELESGKRAPDEVPTAN